MFLALSKTLDLAFAPLTWALLLVLWALWLVLRRPERRRRAAALLGAAVGLLVVFSLDPVGNALTLATEERVDTRRPLTYDAVIVLGGMLDVDASEHSGTFALADPIERLTAGAELFRTGKVQWVLLSGGNVSGVGEPESSILARQLVQWGVPAERIVVEGASRNTRENAEQSARIVRERGWKELLLVTSAAHMPRALHTFRKVGLSPDALAVDFHGHPTRLGLGSLLPRAETLARSTSALRELAGRVVYRLRD